MSNLLSGDGRYQDLLGLNSSSLSVNIEELEVQNSLVLEYIDPNKNIVSDANRKLISEDKDTFINTDSNISISQSNRQFTFDLSLGLNGDSNVITDATGGLTTIDQDTFINTDSNISISQSNRQFTFDLSLGLNGDKNVITDATGGLTTIDQDTILGTTNQVIVNQVGRQFTLSTPQDIATTSDVSFNKITLPTTGTNTNPSIEFGTNNNGIRGGNNFMSFVINGNEEAFIDSTTFATGANGGLSLGAPNRRFNDLYVFNGFFQTQLQIGGNVIDTTTASYLSTINQFLSTTASPTFDVITCNAINGGSVSHTSIECDTIHIPFDNTGTKGLFFGTGTGTTMGFYGYSNSRFGFKINNQDQYFLGDAFRPANDNVKDLGELANRWKNIHSYNCLPAVKVKSPLVEADDEIKLSDFLFTKNPSSSNIVVSRQGGVGNLEFDQINIIPTSNVNTIGTSSSRWSNIYTETINTGNGDVECYAMDQPVRTTDNVDFNDIDCNTLSVDTLANISLGYIDRMIMNGNPTYPNPFIAMGDGNATYVIQFDDTTKNLLFYGDPTNNAEQFIFNNVNLIYDPSSGFGGNIGATSSRWQNIYANGLDTGHGLNELYAMDQPVRTTDDVKFDNLDVYEVGGTTTTYATFTTGTPVPASVEGRLCDVSVSANKYSIKLTGGSSALTTDRYGMRSSSFQPQNYTSIEVIFECRNLAGDPTLYIGFLDVDATNNSLQNNVSISGTHTFKVINTAQNPDRYIERNPGTGFTETLFDMGIIDPATSTPKAYRFTIQSNGNFTIDFRSSPSSAWQAVSNVGTKNLSPTTNWAIMVWDNNTANSRFWFDVIGTFTATSSGEGTIKTDYLEPYTASTTDDNYVSCRADGNITRWIRVRSGGTPYTRAGFLLSGANNTNSSNYYNSVSSASSGVLIWHFNNSLDFSTASEVMRLTSGGNLTIQGTYSPFTGSHISKNLLEVEDGLLLSSATETEYHTIINSNIYTKLSNTYKDKGVIGVAYNDDEELKIVSNGEGGCQVCSEVIDGVVQTPIEIGDFLCSYFDGYATKQDDDLLHNYTIAKAIQNYDFTTNYIEFVKDDKTYRKGLIAIILK